MSATPGGTRRPTRRGPRARSRSRRGRATRSARAGWASRRRASASTARPTPHRSATRPRTAASACTSPRGVAVRPRADRHAGLHRPGLMRSAAPVTRSSAGCRRLRVGARRRAARAAGLEGVARQRRVGKTRRSRPNFTSRLDAARASSSSRAHGQGVVLNFWASWCVPVQTGGAAARAASGSSTARRASSSSASTRRTSAATRAQFMRKHELTYPVVHDDRLPLWGPYGADGRSRRRSSSTGTARTCETQFHGAV